jgi:hypothetical protein
MRRTSQLREYRPVTNSTRWHDMQYFSTIPKNINRIHVQNNWLTAYVTLDKTDPWVWQMRGLKKAPHLSNR